MKTWKFWKLLTFGQGGTFNHSAATLETVRETAPQGAIVPIDDTYSPNFVPRSQRFGNKPRF